MYESSICDVYIYHLKHNNNLINLRPELLNSEIVKFGSKLIVKDVCSACNSRLDKYDDKTC